MRVAVYMFLVTLFMVSVAAIAALFEPEYHLLHVVAAPFAVFAIARIVSKERITAPLRASAPGMIGEILNCTRCLGTWVALALVWGYAALPKVGGTVIVVFALAGANMLLQALMSTMCACEQRLTTDERDRR